VSEWQTDEDITAAKLNQKEVYIGSSAPSSPTDGQLWFDTVNKKLKYYDANAATWRVVPRVLTDLESRSHADLQNVGTDDHHPKIHSHSEHSFGEAEVVANKDQPSGYAGLDSEGLVKLELLKVEPSDTLRHSNDAEKTTSFYLALIKMKEILVNKAVRGKIRIKFDLKTNSGQYTATAQIYKNDSPLGTLRNTNEISYVTFTEDLDISLNADDKLQIYGKTEDMDGVCYVRNFRLYYDLAVQNDFTNQDP